MKLLATTVVLVIAVVSMWRYRTLNADYGKNRPSLPSDTSFALVYKILVLTVVLVAICSYWLNSDFLIEIHDSDRLRFAGSVLSILGIVGFEASVRALGRQYSPCFDLRMPTEVITQGPYRWLSHPMYLCNLTVLVGVFVSSGSLWALVVTFVVGIYYFRSARTENEAIAFLGKS